MEAVYVPLYDEEIQQDATVLRCMYNDSESQGYNLKMAHI